MRVRVFGLSAADISRRALLFVICALVSVWIGATLVLASAVDQIRSWMRAFGSTPSELVLLVVAAAVAWSVFVIVPMISTRAVLLGKARGRWGLTIVSALELVSLALAGGSSYWGSWTAAALAAVATCAAAVIAWTLTGANSRMLIPRRTGETSGAKRYRIAQRLIVIGGLVGAHSAYLRRGWQCLLYVTILALAFVSARSLLGVLFAAALALMMTMDFVRLEDMVREANGESMTADYAQGR